ncbi:hypothetical protein EVAR_16194_1 [Eumeta japonica]|uniref:Uncharacterized protein n=1 Tax=Eumeta variegata TaxID=151549 RepID=A0A4C1U5V2_EUMVA|nr:hypothetical protein EVAR_16194_1 [Eumeta japonica]
MTGPGSGSTLTYRVFSLIQFSFTQMAPYSPECNSNSSGEQTGAAAGLAGVAGVGVGEAAPTPPATPTTPNAPTSPPTTPTSGPGTTGTISTVKIEPTVKEENESAESRQRDDALSALMAEEYDVDNDTADSNERWWCRHACGSLRHSALTDDYGNFVARRVDDCDCPSPPPAPAPAPTPAPPIGLGPAPALAPPAVPQDVHYHAYWPPEIL